MSLKNKYWNYVYRSGDQNLIKEFYEPALECAIQYDRAVGYFSTEVLMSNLQGISYLIKNNGKMRLIIGHPLKEEEYLALRHGLNVYRFVEDLDEKLERVLIEAKESRNETLKLFGYLVATGKMQIKYAFRRAGMYHEKIGIIKDSNGEMLVFQGSANETVYALSGEYNAESITVFRSWEEDFARYGIEFHQGFENLWENRQKNTVVMDMPSGQYEKIISLTDASSIDPNEIAEPLGLYDDFFDAEISLSPRMPKFIGKRKFELMKHQKEAIARWWQADKPFHGILELATGSGKTITAISAATILYDQLRKQSGKLALIVSVPYVELAQQWKENLQLFNIFPLECWGNSNEWIYELRDVVNRFNLGAIDFFAIVVVNKTLISERFQSAIANLSLKELLVVGDECHHFGGVQISKKVPLANYRLGLSATPFRSDEEDFDSPFPDIAKDRIVKYFNKIVAEYTLEDAINNGVLCNYDYYIVETYLTEKEQDEYDELSSEIGVLIAIEQSSGLNDAQRSKLSILTGKRSMLLGNAENKYIALDTIVRDISREERPLSLFYCGAGHQRIAADEPDNTEEAIRVVDKVSSILSENGWVTSQFTSKESSKERAVRMDDFTSKSIDALVTIRVLDEGVDVPACQKAFLLASTKNRRQYIQRRGRVLRKSAGKDKAEIYDFVTLPNQNKISPYAKNLLKSELERIDEFNSLALNKEQVLEKIDELGLREMGFIK